MGDALVLPPAADAPAVAAAAAAALRRSETEFTRMQELGRGTYGDVWKVRNKLDGRYYALKRVPFRADPEGEKTKKLVREVTVLSDLSHKNIIR